MIGMTNEEICALIEKNKWATGLSVEHSGRTNVYYDAPESNCIELKYPERPLQLPYFTRVISLLNLDREELFNGALLWVTLADIGSPQLEKIGWKIMETMRRGFGENRPLSAAPGHWFRSDEFVELNAFLLPCFVFGWDAYVPPSGQDYFVHISHDEFWMVVAKTAEAYRQLSGQLQDLAPQIPHEGCRSRFCRR